MVAPYYVQSTLSIDTPRVLSLFLSFICIHFSVSLFLLSLMGELISVSLAPLLVLLAQRILSLFLLIVCIHFSLSICSIRSTLHANITTNYPLCSLCRYYNRLSYVPYSICRYYNQLSYVLCLPILRSTIRSALSDIIPLTMLCPLLCLPILQPTIRSALPFDMSADYPLSTLVSLPSLQLATDWSRSMSQTRG
jgi:hypothetical protein